MAVDEQDGEGLHAELLSVSFLAVNWQGRCGRCGDVRHCEVTTLWRVGARHLSVELCQECCRFALAQAVRTMTDVLSEVRLRAYLPDLVTDDQETPF